MYVICYQTRTLTEFSAFSFAFETNTIKCRQPIFWHIFLSKLAYFISVSKILSHRYQSVHLFIFWCGEDWLQKASGAYSWSPQKNGKVVLNASCWSCQICIMIALFSDCTDMHFQSISTDIVSWLFSWYINLTKTVTAVGQFLKLK